VVKYITENDKVESIKAIFKTKDFCLYQDDCLNVMAKFPDNYIDMIFADPPFHFREFVFVSSIDRVI
jgi:16S rRNA G966 N2-methylase RsmD